MSEHLSLQLFKLDLPSEKTVERIKAEANEELLKNNKYSQGKKEYLDTTTLRRMLNEAFNYQWSWEVLRYEIQEDTSGNYAMVMGRLHLPGIGFRDAFGASRLDKKDNSAAFATASSYAFKNAVKGVGFASNLFDENYDEDLWEEEKAPEPVKQSAKNEYTNEQKIKMNKIKEEYGIKDNKDVITFIQIWNPKIQSFKDLTKEKLDEFLKYYETNEEKFEEFEIMV